MQIGALAHRTGVSERLLRYYEEQGLLRPNRRSNGYREYDESHVVTVGHIRALLDPTPCPGMIAHLRREHTRIDETITQLQVSRQALGTLLANALHQPNDKPPAG